jgi:SAM-dependent methyltransferase
MGIDNPLYKNAELSIYEEAVLIDLLDSARHDPPTQEDIWFLMDKVWDKMGCNNKDLDPEKLSQFYSHPVWLLNGLFIETDALSMQHRNSICAWLVREERSFSFRKLLDYGGGFATLGRLLAAKSPGMYIDILEPHPTEFAKQKVSGFQNLNFVDKPLPEYDALVSIDVLEHVPDPLKTFSEMVKLVRVGGVLIIANCFYPYIKCHLPDAFHLRYTFSFFAKCFGLVKLGPCRGSHAIIYVKRKELQPHWDSLRSYEKISKALFSCLNLVEGPLRKIWSLR